LFVTIAPSSEIVVVVGPFTVVAKKGLAYTLNLPKKLRTHPVFYVGLFEQYHDPSQVSSDELTPRVQCGEAGERLLVAQVYSGTCGVRTEVSFGELTSGMDKSRTGNPRRKVPTEIGVCPLCQPLWARLPSGSGDAPRTSCRSTLGLEWESGRNQPWTQPPQPS